MRQVENLREANERLMLEMEQIRHEQLCRQHRRMTQERMRWEQAERRETNVMPPRSVHERNTTPRKKRSGKKRHRTSSRIDTRREDARWHDLQRRLEKRDS